MEMAKLSPTRFPPLLKEIPDSPKELFYRGTLPNWDAYRLLAVVGSRRASAYGLQVCHKLIAGLAGAPVIIVSGLAYGIDQAAHEAALEAGLLTIAVPGSGLAPQVLYPAGNRRLAERIVAAGGLLLSEYPPTQKAAQWTFPRRNRLMAGMSHATLVVEAAEKSGTLITARLTTEYDRELLVVPHDITRIQGKGANQFIKLGATPITDSEDIAEALGLSPLSSRTETPAATPHQSRHAGDVVAAIIALLSEAPREKAALFEALPFPSQAIAETLTLLELEGKISNIRQQYHLR